jgi:hypothetical protein
MTLDQLRAAGGRMEQFEDIGARMAHIIREEFTRLASQGKDRSPPLRHEPKK